MWRRAIASAFGSTSQVMMRPPDGRAAAIESDE
jgi:hypothetical protein